MKEEKMIVIEVYADTTGQYSEEEINRCNCVEIQIPECIARDWFEEKCKGTDFGGYDPSFENWYYEIYTTEDTDGLYDYSVERGYYPVCGRNCDDWSWY